MRPTHLLQPLILSLVLALGSVAMPARAASPASIDKAVELAPKGAKVAVRVEQLDPSGPTTIFDRNGSAAMIPASNLKVLTTAAALAELGPDYRFETKLYLRPTETAGEYDVLVVGGGDPTFGDAELFNGVDGWGVRTVLDGWAALLRERGISRVRALHLDDSVFDGEHDHPNWPANQKHLWYEAQVGGLNLNLNCVGVHLERAGSRMDVRLDPPTNYVTRKGSVSSGKKNAVIATRPIGTNDLVLGGETNAREQGPIRVTVDNPTAYFAAVFGEALSDAGVSVDGSVVGPVSSIDDWELAAVHETPIDLVLHRTNEDSINLYAEALAKLLGQHATGAPGSWQSGGEAVRSYLGSLGVDTTGIFLDDGSGMSRENRITAASMTAALADRFSASDFDLYRDALSDAGSDGTLENRFRDRTDLHGRVWGKTGYINGVSTMSGYLHAKDGRWYAFSVLVNDVPSGQVWRAKAAQEAVVAAIDG